MRKALFQHLTARGIQVTLLTSHDFYQAAAAAADINSSHCVHVVRGVRVAGLHLGAERGRGLSEGLRPRSHRCNDRFPHQAARVHGQERHQQAAVSPPPTTRPAPFFAPPLPDGIPV